MRAFLSDAVATAASAVKIILQSRKARRALPADPGRSIAILGNGPSLRQTIDSYPTWLSSVSRMAVNFASTSSDFRILRPDYYIMIDPVFFPAPGAAPTLADDAWEAIRHADWKMTLFVPSSRLDDARRLLGDSSTVGLRPVNITPVEGWRWFTHRAFDAGLGMPRPRNVLIAAVMAAIGEGFGKIYLAGADHSWTRTLAVDSDNNVCNTVAHFYEEKRVEQETTRIVEAYRGIHLHNVLESLMIAFRSYFHIKAYAAARGVEIINITPGSFIDAFPHSAPPAAKD